MAVVSSLKVVCGGHSRLATVVFIVFPFRHFGIFLP
jgi:hypothetical protein